MSKELSFIGLLKRSFEFTIHHMKGLVKVLVIPFSIAVVLMGYNMYVADPHLADMLRAASHGASHGPSQGVADTTPLASPDATPVAPLEAAPLDAPKPPKITKTLLLASLIGFVVNVWFVGALCRATINESFESARLTRAEFRIALWLLGIGFVIAFLALIPASVIGFIFRFITPGVGLAMAGITYFICSVYLYGRYILIFPAKAVGDKGGLRAAWRLSSENGWSLVGFSLFCLTLFMLSIVISLCSSFVVAMIGALIHAKILGVLLILPIVVLPMYFIKTIFWVGIALAYKQLKTED